MNNTEYHKIINDFFQLFTTSIQKSLHKNLDADICTKIQFKMESASKAKNIESLKENNAIYKLDYAIGIRQGVLAILIPEELIATIADILTGGNGQDVYKGSLSEIETNSILKILEKIFKNIESDFKKSYEHDLAFSTNPSLLLKEMPEYAIESDNSPFDFVISNALNLTENKQYTINILLSTAIINGLIKDLGLSSTSSGMKKADNTSLNVENLKDVKINITAELGRTRVPIKYALELVRGSLIELDTLNNSDIKVFANGVEFALAQVVAVEDNFGLKITKIIPPEERLETV